MKPLLIAAAGSMLMFGSATAATIINKDGQAYTLKITEGGERSEIGLDAGQTIQICAKGCFLTLPNGDREALSGGETVEINKGRARVK